MRLTPIADAPLIPPVMAMAWKPSNSYRASWVLPRRRILLGPRFAKGDVHRGHCSTGWHEFLHQEIGSGAQRRHARPRCRFALGAEPEALCRAGRRCWPERASPVPSEQEGGGREAPAGPVSRGRPARRRRPVG